MWHAIFFSINRVTFLISLTGTRIHSISQYLKRAFVVKGILFALFGKNKKRGSCRRVTT